MSQSPANLPQAVGKLLRRYRLRQARLRAAERLALALALAAGLLLLGMVVDRLVELPAALRAVIPVATVLAPLLAIVAGLLAWRKLPTAHQAANDLDMATGDGRDAVRSCLNFREREAAEPGGIVGFMVTATDREAETASEKLEPRRLLTARSVWRRLGLAIVLGGVLAGLAATPWLPWTLMWQRFRDPLGNYPRPSFTIIGVDAPLEREIAEGDDVTIKVELTGRVPDGARAVALVRRADGEQRLMMSPLPGHRYQVELAGASQPFSFVVVAGDGRSARYRVNVLPRPQLQEITARLEYPRYTRLPRFEGELKYRELKGVPGTRVRLEFTSSLPVKDSWVQFPNRRYRIQWDRQRRAGYFQFAIEDDTSFSIHLEADNGITNRGDTPFRVRALPDNPPTITARGFPEPPTLFREDILNLQYEASDDFGIAEIYVRAWPGMAKEPKFYSVQLDKSVMKKAEGSVSMKLAEFTGEDDTVLRLEVVAVDTRGQESATPRMELTIISETPDRQLTELITIYDECLTVGHRGNLRNNAERLKAQQGALQILLDGMDETTPLTGRRLGMMQGIQTQLRGVNMWGGLDPWTIWVAEWPYSSQRLAELGMAMTWTLRTWAQLEPAVAPIMEKGKENEALPKLRALQKLLDEESAMASALLAGNEGVLKESRLRLMAYQTEKAWLLLRDPGNLSPDLLERLEQQRRELMQGVLEVGEAINDEDLTALLEPLREVSALQQQDPAQVQKVLGDLREALLGGTWLDGHLEAPMMTYRREYSWARLLRRSEATQTQPRLGKALEDYLRLRQDTPVSEDGELFLVVRAHAALTTGDPARIEAAAASIERDRAWAERHDLVERLRRLRLRLHERRIDVAVGRRQPENPGFERAWYEIRELYLSVTRATTAGRWEELEPPVHEQLAGLSAWADVFRPWTARLVWARPDLGGRLDGLDTALEKLIGALEPAIEQGRAGVLAAWPALTADVRASMAAELPQLAVDEAALRQEVAEGEAKLVTLSEAEKKDKTWWWRNAARPRREYSSQMVGRFRSWLMAGGQMLSLKEEGWVRQPASGLEELEALGLFAEVTGALSDAVYEHTWAAHLNRSGGQYPRWLNPIADYEKQLQAELVPETSRWFELAGSDPRRLLDDKAFAAAAAKRSAGERYKRWQKSMADYQGFQAFAVAKPDEAARREHLLALASGDMPSVYWDRVSLALQRLLSTVGGAMPEKQETPFPGLPPAVLASAAESVRYLRSVLPPADDGAEFAAIHQLLGDWDYYATKVTTAAVAALSEEKRRTLGDDVAEWVGRVEGTRRGLDDFVRVPPPLIRPNRQLVVHLRYDVLNVLGRLLRNEHRWGERAAEASRWALSERAQWLAPQGAAPTLDDLAWVTGLEQRELRQSSSVIRRQNQGLGDDLEGPSPLLLKMPKYLYDELMRANALPYPTQFKAPGLAYMKALVQESR